MVGKLYAPTDERRDSGFTLFYMGINLGAMFAPLLTGWMAEHMFGGTPEMPDLQGRVHDRRRRHADQPGVVLVRPSPARRHRPSAGSDGDGGKHKVLYVLLAAIVAIPAIYFLLAIDAGNAAVACCLAMFVALCGMILFEGFRDGPVARDRAIAMLIIFTFNVLFWMLLRTGRQLVQLPRRQDRRPRHVRHGVPGGLVPVGELAGDHRLRADRGVDVDQDGRATTRRSRASSAWASSSTAWPSCC